MSLNSLRYLLFKKSSIKASFKLEMDSLEYMLNDDVNENGDCNDANGENNDEICSKRQRLC
ncbi:hypothetical protein TSAR_003649 [Trichomalopsis sarcophagae]|uniref:Uncharacterized protein n=1 Tax=Trichomalopsis sarcophagae TaxID=543379 RepID=A0A232FDU1_9HYME|nr:hypothetical protein TSAR_003649 [Trichomalopsis sarcophagae]